MRISLITILILVHPWAYAEQYRCARDPAVGSFFKAVVPSIPPQLNTLLTVSAVGDVILHSELLKQGFTHRDGFHSLWADVRNLLVKADITYANVEGPFASDISKTGRRAIRDTSGYDDWVYSGYPMFNYPPELARALKVAGVDVISTANNHSYDRYSVGVDRTIDNLIDLDLAFTGTRRSDRPNSSWHTVTERAGFRIAWLGCTYDVNVKAGSETQVLFCYRDRDQILSIVNALALRRDIHGVIFTPHWGKENLRDILPRQRKLARQVVAAGAVAVIGSHPHVVQGWEAYEAPDGRCAFVHYSLGNFLSGQPNAVNRRSVVLQLEFHPVPSGKLSVHSARLIPVYTELASESSDGTIRVRLTATTGVE